MGTEVIKSYGNLEAQLEKARNNLKGLNDNIRRIIGRDPALELYNNWFVGFDCFFHIFDRFLESSFCFRNDGKKRNSNAFEMPGGRRDREDRRHSDLNPAKRRAIETKSVFSRLSGPPSREDEEYSKPRLSSRVIKEQPTRQEIVAAQTGDAQSRARNRRMFSSLLGTLQKFSQEESRLKPKEEKKAQIEKKLEEQAIKERENLLKEKQCLFSDRKRQQLEIKAIENKMSKMKDFEAWEESKKPLLKYIQTKGKPNIYYLPKTMCPKTEERLRESRAEMVKIMEKKRQEVMEEIAEIEARFKSDVKSLEDNLKEPKSTDEQHSPYEHEEDEDDEHHQDSDARKNLKITIQNDDRPEVVEIQNAGSYTSSSKMQHIQITIANVKDVGQ